MTSMSHKAEVLGLINGYQSTCLILAGSHIGLFDSLLDGPFSVETLAFRLGVDPNMLHRLVRALEALQLLTSGPKGVFLSNTGSLLAVKDSGVSSIPTLISEQYLPAWWNLHRTLVSPRPAFEQIFNVSVWQHRQQHLHLDEAFKRMIQQPTTDEVSSILLAYDFSGFSKVVDVGGGSGWLLKGILEKHSELEGILFDQPHVVSGFLHNLGDNDVRRRCSVVGGSFFELVPSGGDLYILQSILHDWNDEDCVRILEKVHESMRSGDKLLVLERVIPADGAIPVQMAMLDMHMMAVLGGEERTLTRFDQLFLKAGFCRVGLTNTDGFAADIIEVKKVD